jgi:hypothetical protein
LINVVEKRDEREKEGEKVKRNKTMFIENKVSINCGKWRANRGCALEEEKYPG